MNPTTRILTAISATEPCSFGEFLNGLGDDKPDTKQEWAQMFRNWWRSSDLTTRLIHFN